MWIEPRDESALNGSPGGHLAIKRFQEPRLHVFRNALRFDPLIDLQGPLSGIDNDKTVGTFGDVRLKAPLHFCVRVRVEIIVQFLKELFTG
jgi:hypothetical protein